jgi:hypothetical protein
MILKLLGSSISEVLNFCVLFPNKEKLRESFDCRVIKYLPKESVWVALFLLYTITASIGLLPEISYTIPLIVRICAFALIKDKQEMIKNRKRDCFMNGCKNKHFNAFIYVKIAPRSIVPITTH